MNKRISTLTTAFVILSFNGITTAPALEPQAISIEHARAVFNVLEEETGLDPAKVSLGRILFHDTSLSGNDKISCASCHVIDEGGDDNLSFSFGVSGNPTGRNSPTVYNLPGQIAYFWDGRAENLADQMDGPVHHPDEMDSDWDLIVKKIRKKAHYKSAFQEHYGELASEANIKDAIVEFERSLVTIDTPFDRFLAGNETALSKKARKGLTKFVRFGCSSCHQGKLVGGNMFQKLGVFALPGTVSSIPDRLKVPSLRNVEHTAPYFHDGSQQTLTEAVEVMAKVQLGRVLQESDIDELIAFLQSLSSDRFTKHAADSSETTVQ